MTKRVFGVIGLGNFGATVASELQRFGNHVIGIDLDERRVARLGADLSEALILDAREEDALRESGIGECDVALVAMGSDLESSILSVMNLRLLGIKTIWAKAKTKTHHRILSRLGVDRVIHPEVEMGQHAAQVLNNPLVRDYVSLGNGFHVVNFRVPERFADRSLRDLGHRGRFGLRCVGVMRQSDFVGDDANPPTLACDDLVLLLGRRDDLRAFAASL